MKPTDNKFFQFPWEGLLWPVVAVFLAIGHRPALAQETESGSSQADVVEIETEIGVGQMENSGETLKTGIKPRVHYNDTQKGSSENLLLPQSGSAGVQKESVSLPANTTSFPKPQGKIKASETEPDNRTVSPDFIKKPENVLTDVQVVEISSSLRKLIEENETLKTELDQLDQQLRAARGQQRLESNRMNEIEMERDALKKQNENIVALGNESAKNLEKLQQDLTEKENEYNQRILRLQTELANALQSNSVPAKEPENVDTDGEHGDEVASVRGKKSVSVNVALSQDAKAKSEKVMMALNKVTEEKIRLQKDEAKLHYNMGNTYFHQGDYKRSFSEYSLAIALAPDDANAHYNLAFVSGEFLSDPLTALQHYKLYLFLNPKAEDTEQVRQKIIESEISVKADVRFKSRINEELKDKKNQYLEVHQY